MNTHKDFEYDLWTTEEDEVKKYWIRVKATGEMTEISHDVMKLMRSEDKRLYRENEVAQETGTILSLDALSDEERESWFEDGCRGAIAMQTSLEEKEFIRILTEKQLSVYCECLLNGRSLTEYASTHGISKQSVYNTVEAIKKKQKNFFAIPDKRLKNVRCRVRELFSGP